MDTLRTPSPAIPEAQATYVRNMAMLWAGDPVLARRIDAVSDAARHPVAPARSGAWTAAATDESGRTVHLHSRYDPEAEARKLIDGVEVEGQYCFFVGGFGLGYHLLALRAVAGPEALIVVGEPDTRLLAAAFAHVDLTPLLADNRLIILTEPDKAQLHSRLQTHTALLMLGAKFIAHPPSERVAGEFHNRLRSLVTAFVAYSRMTIVTLVANARITCKNIANNIGACATTPSIGILKDRFKGVPGIVVSAGPSLRRNIDQLAGAAGHAVICAVQTTLKTLLDRGIRPDFVTSLDYHPVSEQYFEGLTGLDDVHLVAEPKATWHVIDRYPGPISLLDNAFARLLIGDALAASDGLPAGATVAHLAFYLVRYMGCDPIIFVGQDLAYTGHVYYTPGVEMHRNWQSELNRYNTIETKEWERTVRSRPVLRQTVDQNGKPIYTDELLFTYLEQFERDIAATSVRVINATEGGARIRGAENMTLAEAIERWCGESIPADRLGYQKETVWRDESKLPAVRDELAARLEEVDKLLAVCREMLTLLEKLKRLLRDPPAFNKLLVRVDELRAKVNENERAYRLINASSQLAELRRFSADRRLAADKSQGAERAKRQLDRDVEFVTNVRDGGNVMRDMLVEALDRVKEAVARSAGKLSGGSEA